jgi:hypothetical protein
MTAYPVQISGAMTKREKHAAPSPMAARMRRLRRVMEGDDHGAMTRFCDRLEIGLPRWHAVENGAQVSFALADILMRHFPGLSLDWIYYGRTEGMTVAMAERLGEVPRSNAFAN